MIDKSKARWVAMVIADVDTVNHEEYEWDGHAVATYLQGALNAGIEPGDTADVTVLGRADHLTNPQDLVNTWVTDLEAADEKPWLETRDPTQVNRLVPWTCSNRNTKRGFATELLVCTDDEHAWFVAACLPGDFRVARLITASGNAMIQAARRLGVDALDLARKLEDGQIADLIDSHCPTRDGGRDERLCPELCPHGEHPASCNTCRDGYDDPAEAAPWETPYEEEATT